MMDADVSRNSKALRLRSALSAPSTGVVRKKNNNFLYAPQETKLEQLLL